MSNKPNLVGVHKVYRNKFVLCSFTIVFVTLNVGLLFQTLGAQVISSAKSASQSLPAGDLSVVGQPSLPASTVDAIFKRLGSPMVGTGQLVEQASRQANVDDAFALAVWWTETNDGAAGVGLADRNPGSVRGSVGYPSAFDGYTIYPSYSAAIVYWFNMLKNRYVNRGLSTVYAISHPYVGTSSSPLWAGKVVALMLSYRGEAPTTHTVVHGKKVIEPAAYIHTTPTPLANQAQSQAGKTPEHFSNSNTKQPLNTSTALSPSIEYAIVFLALMLAVAIVTFSLWFDKQQPIRNTDGDEILDEIMEDEGNQDESLQKEVLLGEIVQGGGKSRTCAIRNARPFRSIALYALFENEDAPKTDALVMLAQEMDTSANFRVPRAILLPSLPVLEAAEPGELATTGSLGRRSTGLLTRYSETHQE